MVSSLWDKLGMAPVKKDALKPEDFTYYFKEQGIDPSGLWTMPDSLGLEKLAVANAVTFACIEKIRVAFLEANLRIGRYVDEKWEDVKIPAIWDLLSAPNPDQSPLDFWTYWISHIFATGKSFIWKWRTTGNALVEMWPIPTSWVTVLPAGKLDPNSKVRTIAGYKLVPDKNDVSNPALVVPLDMVFSKFSHPSNFTEGSGPMQAAYRDVDNDGDRQEYTKEMFKNVEVPGAIITTEEEISPKELNQIKAQTQDKIGGNKRFSSLVLSGKGMKFDIPTPMSDFDFPGMASLGETRICATFGVHPLILGLRSGLETSSLGGPQFEAAEKIMYRGTMTGLWTVAGYTLTKGLLRDEGETDLEVRFDSSEVRALQADQSESAKRAETLYKGSLATEKEAREIAGLTVDPDAKDFKLIPTNMERVSVEEAQNGLTLDGAARRNIDQEKRDENPDDLEDEENEEEG